MNDPKLINIQDYTYTLPEEKIALFPLPDRDHSKLLLYREGIITDDKYFNISKHLSAGSLLIFNNSKVINARVKFKKESGAVIEVFCLEPYEHIRDYSSVMNKTGKVKWKCLVGGAAKWKNGPLNKKVHYNNNEISITAILLEKQSGAYIIEFSWNPASFSFAEIIEAAGSIPLPPYIKRAAEPSDTSRYQTIYARHDGSVAAPTAGLHFTENIFYHLSEKNINHCYVTLHVGAGTFKPVKAGNMIDHEMHAEWIDVDIETIQQIMYNKGALIAVGTTSLRTLESLYWLGVKSILNPAMEKLELTQWEVYDPVLQNNIYDVQQSMEGLLNWLHAKNLTRLFTQTQILIATGYRFKMVNAIITNFHQPQSTLLLLVSAAVGDDWKKIYSHALDNDYRFLSYGDGSLLYLR